MPSALKDVSPSPLREIIEIMDVAFRGLKTPLSEVNRSPSAGADNTGSHSTLLRHRPRLSFKGRRVSCKDLGQGDCQGWLYVKKEGHNFLHHDRWSKRWFVLIGHVLYGYKDKEAQKAETLVSLPGFQVSPASDVRSKKHAFRVHNTERSIVFASETQLDMTKWMNKMGLSAISYDSASNFTTGGFSRPEPEGALAEEMYFSDTDEEDERKPAPQKKADRTPGRAGLLPSPSPTSSLDRARQKLRSWRAGSPAPSAGSISSLSSLGSEKQPKAGGRKPSLRFLARVRRDSGASASSAQSVGSQASVRRTSQPDPPAKPQPDVVGVQRSVPQPQPSSSQQQQVYQTPPQKHAQSPSSSCYPAGADSLRLRVPGRPVSSHDRPVPTPRRPRPLSRDQAPPEYVNWRCPGGGGPEEGGGRPETAETEVVIRIGAGGVERIEERERRPGSEQLDPELAAAERRGVSVQHRRVTREGQIVASILAGTSTVPRAGGGGEPPAGRASLPGYMRPTLSSRRQERRPSDLSKQRSISTSRLPPTPAAPGPRRGSLCSEPGRRPAPPPPPPRPGWLRPGSAQGGRRLKKTSQYESPGGWRQAADMRLAFEMDLNGAAGQDDDVFETARPTPPPRLSKSASTSQVPASRSPRQKPNITIQLEEPGESSTDGEPRTPLKPAMGVSMIGKQRRTPTSASASPHFVFPCGSPPAAPAPAPAGTPLSPPSLSSGYCSLSASTHTLAGSEPSERTGISRGIAHASLPPPLPPLSKSLTSPQLNYGPAGAGAAGWPFRVLPKYDLQYPPVFTPDTYSLAQMSSRQQRQTAWDRRFAETGTQTEQRASVSPPSTGERGGS